MWSFAYFILSGCNLKKHPKESLGLPYKRKNYEADTTAKNKYSMRLLIVWCNGKIHTPSTSSRGPNIVHKTQLDRALEFLSGRGWVCASSSSHLPIRVCTAPQCTKMILLCGSGCCGKLQDKKLNSRKQPLMLLACFSSSRAAPQAASRSQAKISTNPSDQS